MTADGIIRVWSTSSGEIQQALVSQSGSFSCVVADAAGGLLAGGTREGSIIGYDRASGQERFRFAGRQWEVTALRLSPRADRPASASIDGTVRVWDIATGAPLHPTIGTGLGQ